MNRSPASPTEPSAHGDHGDEWVVVNGHQQALLSGSSLVALLRGLDVTTETKGVAVAVNDELVPRANWPDRRLQPGDRIELVRAVQGG